MLSIYMVRLTKEVEAHVIAESASDARDLAEACASDWFHDGDPSVDATAHVVVSGWDEHELPYLTDEAMDHATRRGMDGDSTVAQWAAALKE